MTAPSIIELPSSVSTLAAKAKFWRKNVVKLSRKELSSKTGYSVQAIAAFECGHASSGQPLKDRAWLKYRLICAGLTFAHFDWDAPKQDQP